VFALVQLKTTPLDIGIPGFSAVPVLLVFLMILAIPMIPYLFLYLGLRNEGSKQRQPPRRTIADRLHLHRHPVLLHH
jgi:hypothetical protein